MSHSAPTPAAASRGTVTLLVPLALVVLTQLYAAIPLLGPVAVSMGGDATFALSTSFSLTYVIGFLLWGPISDRYGRSRVMAAAIGALTVATFLCSFATSLPMLALLGGAQELAAAGFAPVALAYLSETVAPQRRSGVIGAMSTAFLVAGIAGQVVAAVIALRLGWPWFFGISAAVLAVGFGLLLALVEETGRKSQRSSLIGQFATLGRLALTSRMMLLSGAHVTVLLSFVAMYTALGGHLVLLGMSASTVVTIRLLALPVMFLCLGLMALAALTGTLRRHQRARYEEAIERAAFLEGHRETERRLAAAEERTRIAREMHDVLGHSLNTIAMQAEGARYLVRSVPERTDQVLADIGRLSRAAVDDVRELINVTAEQDTATPLRPGRTLSALAELIKDLQHTGAEIELRIQGDPTTIPDQVGFAGYRIVQESLTNALRHAVGAAIRVNVMVRDGAVVVSIHNSSAEGRATCPPQRRGGISGMRERAQVLGGTLTAGPDPDTGGWRVTAVLPWGQA